MTWRCNAAIRFDRALLRDTDPDQVSISTVARTKGVGPTPGATAPSLSLGCLAGIDATGRIGNSVRATRHPATKRCEPGFRQTKALPSCGRGANGRGDVEGGK